MIDEKKLIESLKTDFYEHYSINHSTDEKDLFEMFIDNINEQPKLNEWIPVEKGLPKNNQEVIVTFVNHKPPLYYQEMKDVPISAFAVYYNSKWYWWNPITCDSEIIDKIDKDIEIIAWMPPPKPYGGKK